MKTSKKIVEEAKHLLLEGKVSESIDAFTKAINSGEKSDIVFLSRGVAYLRNHDSKKAVSDFTKVVDHDDNNARAHYYRGIAYLTMDDNKGAITDFDKTIQIDPENAAAFFARGAAYANIGNDDMARKNIKTAITFSESGIYGLQETIGLLRTQFDKAMSLIEGEEEAVEIPLSDDEVKKLKKWIAEGYKVERDQ